jgi:hypothetical protein
LYPPVNALANQLVEKAARRRWNICSSSSV